MEELAALKKSAESAAEEIANLLEGDLEDCEAQ